MLTVNDIIYRIYENPLLQNVRKSDIVTHIKSVIKLLDLPATFEEKRIVVNIQEYRARIPKDLYEIKSVMAMNYGGAQVRVRASSDDRVQQQNEFRGSRTTTIAYKIVPGYIYTEFQSGDIELIYTAFSTDEKGFPLIPDEESLVLAIENYIKVRHFTILFENKQLSENILNRAEQQYSWYIGQAANKFTTPTPEQTESLLNAFVRLIPNRKAIEDNFKFNSVPENIRIQE